MQLNHRIKKVKELLSKKLILQMKHSHLQKKQILVL